ncbi:MAG: hypothetical protein NT072_11995, partial [Deltaproteobacteria bacterium]|nr:hypothetical protein [Deltaproteobacteria bacterium]
MMKGQVKEKKTADDSNTESTALMGIDEIQTAMGNICTTTVLDYRVYFGLPIKKEGGIFVGDKRELDA